jgi:hypothetical protein
MKAAAIQRIDLSVVVSITAALVLFKTILPLRMMPRIAGVLVETAWLYLSNTRG